MTNNISDKKHLKFAWMCARQCHTEPTGQGGEGGEGHDAGQIEGGEEEGGTRGGQWGEVDEWGGLNQQPDKGDGGIEKSGGQAESGA
jgi:hypothetical protein